MDRNTINDDRLRSKTRACSH